MVTVARFSGQVVVICLSGDKTDFAFCNLVLFPAETFRSPTNS